MTRPGRYSSVYALGRDLVAGYGGLDILHGVSIDVGPDEIVTIIGPNGAGKSTLLKSIFGLVPPRAGSVTFMGKDVTGERPNRLVHQGMCFVPQNRNVFPRLTVEENLQLGAYILNADLRERIARVYDLFPPQGEKAPARGHPFRRSAADGGDRPGADARPQAPPLGRADGRPLSRFRPADPRKGGGDQRGRGAAF